MTEIKNTSVIDFSDISDEQMNEMIDGTLTEFDEGDLVDGTVVKLEHDEVLVDIGFKSEGVIPARELSIRKDADPSDIVSLGDKIEALVLQKEDKDGRLILSKKRAEYERAWISVEEKFKAGEVVTGEVIEVVKGGLILDIGLRGFLPASLVDLRRVKDLDAYLGTEIEARVIEMDRNRNNVVLSRRVLLEEGRRTSAPRSWRSSRRACASRAPSPRSSTSAPSWTWAASTAWCTSPSCLGTMSTIPPRSSRWATRWRLRCSTSICSASASPSVSSRPRPTRGSSFFMRTSSKTAHLRAIVPK